MPKQVLEISAKKGLNNGFDSRDIDINEADTLSNVLINEKFGVIGPASDSTAHAAGTADTGSVATQGNSHGHNLFYFSHDMTSFFHQDILANGKTNQNSGSIWAVSGDFSKNATNFTYNRGLSSSGGYIEQTAANRNEVGLNSHKYVLKINISTYSHTSGSASLSMTGGSGFFASANKDIFSNGSSTHDMQGTHLIQFTSHSSASTGVFRLVVSNYTGTGTEMIINSLELYPIPSNTGENYLLLRTGNQGIDAISTYHYSTDKWFGGILNGDRNTPKYVFWQVDGNIRISDAKKYSDSGLPADNWIGHVNRIRFSNFGVNSFVDSTPTPSGAWEASQSHVNIQQTSTGSTVGGTNGSGEHIKVRISTDGSGNPSIAVTSLSGASVKYGGTGYLVGDYIRFTDPGSTSNTCDVQVSTIQEVGHEINRWVNTECKLIPPRYENASTDQFDLEPTITTPNTLSDGVIQVAFVDDVENSGTWNTTGASGTSTTSSSGTTLKDSTKPFTINMVGNTIQKTSYIGVVTSFVSDTEITTSGTPNWSSGESYTIRENYDLGMSWVYDGNQESLITKVVSNYTFNKNSSLKWHSIAANGYWDSSDLARITGANLYWKKSKDATKTWYHLYEIDLNKGGRVSIETDFIKWKASDSKSDTHYGFRIYGKDGGYIYIYDPPQLETYESRNGFISDENNLLDISNANTSVGMGYSAVVVANRTAYIGNVQYKNKYGITKNYGDLIFKSMPNKFDTFPLDRKMEVTVQDGDEITALETYADRLLQFKKNKMHLINISQEIEFLEDSFEYKGVAKQSAVCKTDYGIAWANNYGCFLYDGKNVIDLIGEGGLKKIADSLWFTDSAVKDNMQTGYLPLSKELIIHQSSEGREDEGDGNSYMYNFVYKNWVRHINTIMPWDGGSTTNLITDRNGDLIWSIGAGVIKKWNTSYGTKYFQYNSSDIDFGNPSVRKKIYRVRISYKGNGTAITAAYNVNGKFGTSYYFEGLSSGKPTGSQDTTPFENLNTLEWHHAELKPATSDANNVYSFRFKISGTPSSSLYGFLINDISIIYREKTIK